MVSPFCSFKESPGFGKSRKNNTVENNLRTRRLGIAAFSYAMGN